MKKPLDSLILTIRDQKVILDGDLAELYGVPTKVFNQAIKRNADRFPEDFCFQLTAKEWADLKSQRVTSSVQPTQREVVAPTWSQFVTSSKKHRGAAYRPFAFTEHGAIMAATVLNSAEAVSLSVYVVRAFIKQRELLMAHSDVLKKLALMDARLLKHDDILRVIWRELQPLLNPPPEASKPQIGFNVKEESPAYRIRKRVRKSRV